MRRSKKNKSQNFLLILCLSFSLLLAKDPGLKAFYKGDYKKSSDYYEARLNKDSDNEKILYNRGTSAMAEKDFEIAESLLKQSLASKDDEQLAKAYYNLGQISLEQEKTEEALDNFKKSMIYDPESPDPKIMYEHIQQMMQEQQQQQEQDQGEGSDNEDKDSQENKEQNEQKQENKDQEGQENQQDPEQDQQPEQNQQQSQLTEDDLKAEDVTKEQAKNILNSMKEDEKESMKKLILSKAKSKRVKRSKEW
ncbi:MAG: tetratricopeptide repeat protein [Candidatus Neomarinimicrobiota bacterium]